MVANDWRDGLLRDMRNHLANYRPAPPAGPDLDRDRAAVLIAVSDAAVPQVLLIEKADHLRRHAGEVALPGGRVEAGDASVAAAALREAAEEVALPVERVELLGELDSAVSRHGLLVTPVVGLVSGQIDLRADPREVAGIFHWPLTELVADRRVRTDRISRSGRTMLVPRYEWQGRTIWGLTALLLARFANVALRAGIELGEH